MPVKVYKPTSPGRRGMSASTFEEITRTEPEKSLVQSLHSSGGRNHGASPCGIAGGGHKRLYRVIDFRRDKHGIPARVTVSSTTRTVRPASRCWCYADGEKRYIIAPLG